MSTGTCVGAGRLFAHEIRGSRKVIEILGIEPTVAIRHGQLAVSVRPGLACEGRPAASQSLWCGHDDSSVAAPSPRLLGPRSRALESSFQAAFERPHGVRAKTLRRSHTLVGRGRGPASYEARSTRSLAKQRR